VMGSTTDDRGEEKMRPCLGPCRRMFLSKHCGNRVCPKCAAKPITQSGIPRMSIDIDSISEKLLDDEFYCQGRDCR